MSYSAQIKAARLKLGLSQSQAAKTWGVPLKTLQQWEQDKADPRGLGKTKLEEILASVLGK